MFYLSPFGNLLFCTWLVSLYLVAKSVLVVVVVVVLDKLILIFLP